MKASIVTRNHHQRALIITLLFVLLSSTTYAQREERLPFPVPLNHFYLTVDSETFAAIEGSEFLRSEFAAFERRTTVRTDKTYTGIYFYGTHTYFEFFDVANSGGFKLGDSGIAFGVEVPDATKTLQTRLGALAPQLVTRQYKDVQVPWFYMLNLVGESGNSVITSWVMEYHPQFLLDWNPSNDGNQGILRNNILSRYKSVLNKVPSNPLLDDIVGLTIAADREMITNLTRICERLGYRSHVRGDTVELHGPDLTLHLIPESPSARGIKQIEFRVRRKPKGQAEFHFGNRSLLKFQSEQQALWTF